MRRKTILAAILPSTSEPGLADPRSQEPVSYHLIYAFQNPTLSLKLSGSEPLALLGGGFEVICPRSRSASESLMGDSVPRPFDEGGSGASLSLTDSPEWMPGSEASKAQNMTCDMSALGLSH